MPLALGLVLLLAGTSRAQLLVTLTPAGLSGFPGTTLRFAGTLVNTGASELFLNADAFSLSSPDLTLDDTKFFAVPPLLAGGASFSGELFDVLIAPTAAVGTYSGSFTVQGGASNTVFDPLATGNFQVTVIVPEPGTGALLAATVMPLVGILRRRGR